LKAGRQPGSLPAFAAADSAGFLARRHFWRAAFPLRQAGAVARARWTSCSSLTGASRLTVARRRRICTVFPFAESAV